MGAEPGAVGVPSGRSQLAEAHMGAGRVHSPALAVFRPKCCGNSLCDGREHAVHTGGSEYLPQEWEGRSPVGPRFPSQRKLVDHRPQARLETVWDPGPVFPLPPCPTGSRRHSVNVQRLVRSQDSRGGRRAGLGEAREESPGLGAVALNGSIGNTSSPSDPALSPEGSVPTAPIQRKS